jgi:hypothetical protein
MRERVTLAHMSRLLIRSVLVAVTLVISLDAGIAAKRPTRFVICDTDVEPLPISIQVVHGEKVKDAVEHCLTFWNGVVLDIER